MSSALFAAVASGDQTRAKFLLNRGVRINIRDPRGENILVTALRIEPDRRRMRMFRWLLTKGADILALSQTTGRDLLIWAAYLNRPAELSLVIEEAGGELDFRRKDFKGFTALHYGTTNDSSDIVRHLCEHMRRYDICVDTTDAQGLTPYLLARRLGHNTCAHILVQVGDACPHKGDEITGQSQHFWETLGSMERSRKEDAEKGRVVALYKQMGRLPQLKKARFDTDQIKLVSSENERRIIEEGRILKRHGTLAPLDISSFDPNEPIISSKIHTDRSAHIPPSVLMNIHQELEKDGLFRRDGESKDPSPPQIMSDILDLASVQETHSYKPPARQPKHRGSVIGAAHAAAFGLRLKKKMINSKGGKKVRDNPGSAMNRDHLPIIVQS